MPRPRRSQSQRAIEAYDHAGQERLNNPPVGLVSPDTDRDAGRATYQYDLHLDPQLQWTGKAEHTSFEVPTVSLHIREDGPAQQSQRIVVSFGPEHAPLEQRQVEWAIREAQTLVPRPRVVVFPAFQFDSEASKDIDETNWPGVTLLRAQINADLLTTDLKKGRASNESFWLIGQPDVELQRVSRTAKDDRTGTASPCTDSTTTTPRPATWNQEVRRQDRPVDRSTPTMTAAASFPGRCSSPWSDGRRGLVQPRPQPQGRDRRGPDRGLPGRRLAPLRGRGTSAGGGKDRGRQEDREPEGRRNGLWSAACRPVVSREY